MASSATSWTLESILQETPSADVEPELSAWKQAWAEGPAALQKKLAGEAGMPVLMETITGASSMSAVMQISQEGERNEVNALLRKFFTIPEAYKVGPLSMAQQLRLRAQREGETTSASSALLPTVVEPRSPSRSGIANVGNGGIPAAVERKEVFFLDAVKIADRSLATAFATCQVELKAELQRFPSLEHKRFFVNRSSAGFVLTIHADERETTEAFSTAMNTIVPEVLEVFDGRRETPENRMRYDAVQAKKAQKRNNLISSDRLANLIEQHNVSNKIARRGIGCIIRNEEQQQVEAGLAKRSDLVEDAMP